MSDKTLSQRLREIAANIPTRMSMNDQGWSPSDVAEMIRAIAAQAEAQDAQAIGEQTPVAKPNDWSNPEYRAKVFLERMLRLREDVSRWQGKCAVLRHENNKLRAAKPMSSEARDKAIEWLGDAQHHLSNGRIGEVCIAVDQALSALRS